MTFPTIVSWIRSSHGIHNQLSKYVPKMFIKIIAHAEMYPMVCVNDTALVVIFGDKLSFLAKNIFTTIFQFILN